MTVDAINGADAQVKQQKKTSPIVPALLTGAVGAAAGYALGGKAPDLNEIFAQKPDVFEATMKTAIDKNAEAAKVLEDTLADAKKAGATQIAEVRSANNALNTAIKNQTVDKQNDLQKSIDDAEKAYFEKKVKIGDKEFTITDIAKDITTKRDDLKNATTDDAKKTAQEALDKANKNAKEFHKGSKTELNELVKTKTALNKAKTAKFAELTKADTAEGKAAKKMLDNLEEATKKYEKAFTDKLDELKNSDSVKEAYSKIKKALPKEGKGKAAMIYGGIAAAASLVIAIISGKKSKATEA